MRVWFGVYDLTYIGLSAAGWRSRCGIRAVMQDTFTAGRYSVFVRMITIVLQIYITVKKNRRSKTPANLHHWMFKDWLCWLLGYSLCHVSQKYNIKFDDIHREWSASKVMIIIISFWFGLIPTTVPTSTIFVDFYERRKLYRGLKRN